MSCANRTEELGAFLDGELSAEETAALVTHLSTCPDCAQKFVELAQLRAALTRAFPEEEASPEFIRRIETSIEDANAKRRHGPIGRSHIGFGWRWAWFGAAAALAAMLVFALLPRRDPALDLMAVRDAALRATMPDSRPHTPAPVVAGFQLASARTDIIAGHVSQVLVYRGAGGAVTLCIWAANGEPAHGVRNAVYQGEAISYWNDGVREFWAASAQPGAPFTAFVHAMTAG